MGAPSHSTDWIVAVVFGDLALLLVLSSALSVVARWFRQPAVIGEIVAGVALGPSLLGLVSPGLPARLFPLEVRPYLTVLAQFGLVLFMFGVGYEVDGSQLRRQGRVAAAVSGASIALPFGLGALAALVLYPAHDVVDGKPVSELALALFLGAAMSITAFPVLARILTERGLHRNRIGTLSLGCAAVNDFAAWCILAVVIAVVAAGSAGGLAGTLVGSAVFLAAVVWLLRPAVRWLAGSAWTARQSRSVLVVLTVVGVLACSAATAWIGLHPVFGAFALGVVVPRREMEAVTPGLGSTVEHMSAVLLPVFFIVTGLNVDLRSLGTEGLLALALVVPLACVGKFVGAAGAARLAGFGSRQAIAVGLLMNTRGLTELIILTIGLELGVLDTGLFTIMVIMALVTTVATGPLLEVVYPRRLQEADDLPTDSELHAPEVDLLPGREWAARDRAARDRAARDRAARDQAARDQAARDQAARDRAARDRAARDQAARDRAFQDPAAQERQGPAVADPARHDGHRPTLRDGTSCDRHGPSAAAAQNGHGPAATPAENGDGPAARDAENGHGPAATPAENGRGPAATPADERPRTRGPGRPPRSPTPGQGW